MHSPLADPQKLYQIPEISKVKVKFIEKSPEKQLVIRPIKIAVKFPDTRSRSLSANNKFKNVFQIPNTRKKQKKTSIVNIHDDSLISHSKYSEIKYLNEISSIFTKENKIFRIKIKKNTENLRY